MSEVHRYKVVKMLSEAGNRISYDPHGPAVVMAEAYDQLKAENEALRKALGDCADELQAEVICKHGGQKVEEMHPVTRRLYHRDMAAVVEARAALAKELGQ